MIKDIFNLIEKTCTPCKGEASALLTQGAANKLLLELNNGWVINNNRLC